VNFTPPKASLGQLKGVPFNDKNTVNTAPKAKSAFDAFDKLPKNTDRSNCKALLQFGNGTVFWSSKMAIDADGPAAGPGRRSGSELDPTPGDDGKPEGQDDTSFHFPNGGGLPSETVPYIVLPHLLGDNKKLFHPDLQIGDVAIVIFADKITAAICGDIGPAKKIGEASIRVHEALHPPVPDPCKRRDQNNFCKIILNASIEQDVLFFVFPRSGIPDLTLQNIETQVQEKAFSLYNALRGIS